MRQLKNIQVLLVDDERAFVDTLARRLKMRNLQVSVVYDGEQALRRVQGGFPDVMVLDLTMPGLQGFDVLRQVRVKAPQTQVVVLTGHGSERDAETVKQLGGFGFLKKPADIDALVAKIREASRAKPSSAVQ